MRSVCFTLSALMVVCTGSIASAQYGLYGSPDTLRLAQQPETYPATNYPTNSGPVYPIYYPATVAQAYPASVAPAAVPAVVAPAVPGYGYPVQPQYRDVAPVAVAYPAMQYGYPAQAGMTPNYGMPSYQAAGNPVPQPQGSPVYRYPAQQMMTGAYQPYQAGAQYCYPRPSGQPVMRMASTQTANGLQPIPTPAGVPAAPVPAEGPVPQSSMMNELLNEQANNGVCTGGVYRGAVDQYEQAACGPQADLCGCEGYCPWYASVSALVMNRSDGRGLWTSYQTTDLREQAGFTQMPLAWRWGGEARFGRRFCCCGTTYAVEAVYWTTEALTGYRSTSFAGDTVNTVLDVNNMTFLGQQANTWFMGAGEQTLVRRDEYHNVEINLVREQLAWSCESPWDIGWSFGVRYFRFEESLTFDSVMPGHTSGGIYDALLRDQVENNLIGAQFGFDAAYNVYRGIRFFITPKVGIYDNALNNTFYAQLGDGTNGISTPYATSYPVHASSNAVAFLTQVDLGLDWQFSRNWSFRGGYRVLAATGVAFADDQFPQTICDIPQLQSIQNPSSLVLHGAFFGLTYNF